MNTDNQYTPNHISHPGETLREKLEEMGLGPKEFSVRSNKPEKTITAVLQGESGITPDMAVQFESALGIPARFWLERQRQYEEAKARERQQEMLTNAETWARKFPYAAMAKIGWVPTTSKAKEKAAHLLQFFGVATPESWQKYYFEQRLKVAFRISLASSQAPYAIAAWLRHGEIQAQSMQAPAFQVERLKQVLPQFQQLAKDQPADFFVQLQRLCRQVGLLLFHTPCLPKAPINGASRWVRDRPLVQLSGRHRRNDIFWFTFFHELGHIFLHGKKYISLEEVAYEGKNLQYEQEADAFAQKHLLTDQHFAKIKESFDWSEEAILRFSESFHLHPAMILGRLQREGLLPHNALPHLFETVDLNPLSNH